jgi:hypothetical protein
MDREKPEAPETIGELIEFGVNAILDKKWTATPAEVISYDSSSKRVKVKVLPLRVLEDGSVIDYPIMSNVPVQFVGGGGFTILAPLETGDKVLLVFCRRGISEFKKEFKGTATETSGVMQVDSAVAIPCFGSLSVTPSDGLSLQKEDGSVKVEILESSVKLTTNELSGSLELTSTGEVVHGSGAKITALGDFVTATGVSLNNHPHAQGTDSAGDVQVATSPPTPTEV